MTRHWALWFVNTTWEMGKEHDQQYTTRKNVTARITLLQILQCNLSQGPGSTSGSLVYSLPKPDTLPHFLGWLNLSLGLFSMTRGGITRLVLTSPRESLAKGQHPNLVDGWLSPPHVTTLAQSSLTLSNCDQNRAQITVVWYLIQSGTTHAMNLARLKNFKRERLLAMKIMENLWHRWGHFLRLP